MWLLLAVCPDVGVQRLPSAAAMVGRVFFFAQLNVISQRRWNIRQFAFLRNCV
jgi:hypothetical protein